MEVLIHSPCCCVEYDADGHLLVFTPCGSLQSCDFRASYNEALAARQQLVHRWLTDYSQLQAGRYRDQAWLVEHWMPRFVEQASHALRRSAVVNSTDAVGQFFTCDMITRTQHVRHWELRHFADRAPALAWLRGPLDGAAATA